MRILKITIASIAVFCFFSFTNSDLPIQNYINQYNIIAVQEMHRTGIPASITLAQGIIESRFGTSGLSKNSNNHFGIKCKKDWQGRKYFHKDDDYENGKLVKSCFRTYANPEESYYDHSEFLLTNSRYQPLFKLEKTDYKGWAKGLKKYGYATAKNYAAALINTVEKYQLHLYDYQQAQMIAEEELIAPKAERIRDYMDFSMQPQPNLPQEYIEIATATSPPPPSFIPENYRIGDGFNLSKRERSTSNFQEDVFGNSSRYLEEISPQLVDR